MPFKVFVYDPAFRTLQKGHFPRSLPPDLWAKYAFITLSDLNTYFLNICIHPQLEDGVCALDENVFCLPRNLKSGGSVITVTDIKVVNSIKLIKTARVNIVFKSVLDLQNWRRSSHDYAEIVKEILENVVLANNLVIDISRLNEINNIGIHLVIVKNIGNFEAGKLTESSVLDIQEVLSFDRYAINESASLRPPGGLQKHFKSLQGLISSYQALWGPDNLKANSSLKVLVIGPDGCGKKSLIHAVASDRKAVVVTIDASELSRPLPGESEGFLKEKFDQAYLHSEDGLTFIVMNRLEAAFRKEGRLLSEFLRLLDAIPADAPLVVIATTSSPSLLHPSIRSSARFHNRVYIHVPTEEERQEMLREGCGELLTEEQAKELALKTPGFVLADISLLITRAKRQAQLSSPQSPLCEDELYKALNECLYEMEGSSIRGELGVVQSERMELGELGGLADVKEVLLRSVCWPLLHPDSFARLNIRQSSGVLLYGPPGCAKISLARAIASSSPVTFLSVSAADLFSPYLGDAELTLVSLFQRARQASPTVLFVDEIDALVGSREEKTRGAQERLLSTFLIEMDGVGVKSEASQEDGLRGRVTVIGATNRPDCLDPALLRPGRLDRLLYVPPPNSSDRLDILNVLTKKIPLSRCVDLKAIAEKTEYYSGADLKSLCQEAGLEALRARGMSAELVTSSDWEEALQAVPPSLRQEQLDWYNSFTFS